MRGIASWAGGSRQTACMSSFRTSSTVPGAPAGVRTRVPGFPSRAGRGQSTAKWVAVDMSLNVGACAVRKNTRPLPGATAEGREH
jgi:hypothetical protein